ncbi:hypothetical protein SRB17_89290 [Streptomyces sp. RB17]|nr:hypothetical protein [Streptomyces sp. RB17]
MEDLPATGLFGIQLRELVLGIGEADFESFDLAQPALALGFGDPGQEVVADLGQARALSGWILLSQGFADPGFLRWLALKRAFF